MVTNLRDIEAADVRVGMRVGVGFQEIDGVRLPQFSPLGGQS
jgi:hypothetical protein